MRFKIGFSMISFAAVAIHSPTLPYLRRFGDVFSGSPTVPSSGSIQEPLSSAKIHGMPIEEGVRQDGFKEANPVKMSGQDMIGYLFGQRRTGQKVDSNELMADAVEYS